ncbi:MAG TPA: hypothetical protein VF683_07205 [Chthoniobacterales bacterium]|jgi:hypothetical protein
MRSAAAGPAEFTPVFDWTPPRNRKGLLAAFIGGSALLHALCFYIFQVIYPPTVSLLPPPARINMITPESEDGRVLLRWIEAEDPALSSTTQRPANASALQLPQPTYSASFDGRRPALRELPPYQPDLSVPSARPPGSVPLARPSATPQPVSVPTRVSFAENVVGAPQGPPLQFTASRSEPPQPAQFRIAIGAPGDVRHCFLEASSEDPALDEQARNYLLRCRFPDVRIPPSASPKPVIWTTVTFEWGNDFARPAESAKEKRKP